MYKIKYHFIYAIMNIIVCRPNQVVLNANALPEVEVYI